eukprot:9501031-Pyramimonas_sp.AAC.1
MPGAVTGRKGLQLGPQLRPRLPNARSNLWMSTPLAKPHREGEIGEPSSGVLAMGFQLQQGREAAALGLRVTSSPKTAPIVDQLLPHDSEGLEPRPYVLDYLSVPCQVLLLPLAALSADVPTSSAQVDAQ